jgi:hypothetical protein
VALAVHRRIKRARRLLFALLKPWLFAIFFRLSVGTASAVFAGTVYAAAPILSNVAVANITHLLSTPIVVSSLL